MLSQAEQASLNVELARDLRAAGRSYREIRRALGLTPAQLGHVRRRLKREKAACTRLAKVQPGATRRDLPVAQSVLSPGLRRCLIASGHRTLGDIADRLADPARPGLAAIAGVGPHRARLVSGLLDQFGLLPETADLQAEVERLFPELSGGEVAAEPED